MKMPVTDLTMLRQAFAWAKANGWQRDLPSSPLRYGRIWAWRNEGLSAQIMLLKPGNGSDHRLILNGGSIELNAIVRRVDYALNLIAASGWIDITLCRLWERGNSEGICEVADFFDGMQECAEGYTLGERPDIYADDILGAALAWLRYRAFEPDIGDDMSGALDGLLDRHPYVRRGQLDSIREAVFIPLSRVVADAQLAARKQRAAEMDTMLAKAEAARR